MHETKSLSWGKQLLIEIVFFVFRQQIKSLVMIAGEYNFFQKDKQEQNIPVSKIIIHPDYNRLRYMNSDIAPLHLKHKVKSIRI